MTNRRISKIVTEKELDVLSCLPQHHFEGSEQSPENVHTADMSIGLLENQQHINWAWTSNQSLSCGSAIPALDL